MVELREISRLWNLHDTRDYTIAQYYFRVFFLLIRHVSTAYAHVYEYDCDADKCRHQNLFKSTVLIPHGSLRIKKYIYNHVHSFRLAACHTMFLKI